MSQVPPPPTLEYSPKPTAMWRRRRVWRAAIVVLLITAAAIGYRHRSAIGLRARQLYWAQQCGRFAAAADTRRSVVGSAQLATLKNRRDYIAQSRIGRSAAPTTQPVFLFAPDCWRRFAPFAGARPYHFFNEGTIFLHELRTPAGKRRIVHIETVGENMYRPAAHLVPTIVEPPTLFVPPRIIYEPSGAYAISEAYQPARLHIGQADPNDPSHFTIGFESVEQWGSTTFPKRHGIIDGRIGDDDRVRFTVRDPASTQGL